MSRSLLFRKGQRLVSNRQIKAVLNRRQRYTDGLLVVYAAPNNCDRSRLGISIGRSCGNAVVRNRLKRLLREAFRLSQFDIPKRTDYVVMMALPHKGVKKRPVRVARFRHLSLAEVQDSFVHLAQQVTPDRIDRCLDAPDQ